MRCDRSCSRAGFTLIEVLVALTVLLAFAAALGPSLFQSRQILARGNGQVAAHLLLRSLIDAPFDREVVGPRQFEGETGGLRWRVAVAPQWLDTPVFPDTLATKKTPEPPADTAHWVAYRVSARVWSNNGQSVAAQTVRLGRAG